MNLRHLSYIVTVADLRNFTHAAQALNVSQPALSSQIRKIEREFGADIFERRPGEVRLTGFGAELVDLARQIGVLAEKIDHIAQRYSRIDATPLRLGMTPTLAAYVSGYFKTMIAELFPGLHLILVEEKPSELARLVETHQIDVALIARLSHARLYEHGSTRSLHFTPLWLEPLFLGVRHGHDLAEAGGIAARDVPRELLIRFDIPFGYDLEADLPVADPRSAELAGIDVRSARFETLCRHVAQCDACTIINAIAAMQFKKDNLGLAFVAFTDDGNLRELGVISRQDYARMKIVTRMQEFIREAPPAGTMANGLDAGAQADALAGLTAQLCEASRADADGPPGGASVEN